MAKSITSLSVGDKIKFGKYQVETETPQEIIWKIADKNHNGYPIDSITLLTEKIIDLRGFDATLVKVHQGLTQKNLITVIMIDKTMVTTDIKTVT